MNREVTQTAACQAARVDVRDVALSFGGQTILADVSFLLEAGEMVLLRGENGSGKTVLLNVLSGYLSPDRGLVKLQLGGKWLDATRSNPERLARRGVGRLWQEMRLFPTMTVLDNVLAATPRMLGENPLLGVVALPAVLRQERKARERARHNLAVVGLADRERSSCDMLSVGQMKRVALARVLQMEPALLLLDEPLAGLDESAAAAFAADLGRLRRELGKTVLVAEHRHDVLEPVADRVWRLSNGRIDEIGVRHA